MKTAEKESVVKPFRISDVWDVQGADRKVRLKIFRISSLPMPQDGVLTDAREFRAHVPIVEIAQKFPSFNPRTPNLNYDVYHNVEASLRDPRSPFVVLNMGIEFNAEAVRVQEDGKIMEIDFGDPGSPNGLLNGGRTYANINKVVHELGKDAPHHYVAVTVWTGIPKSVKIEMAVTRNSSKSIEITSVTDFRGEFQMIKKALQDAPYFPRIVWEEGKKRANAERVEGIIARMSMLNTDLYPNKNPNQQPVAPRLFSKRKRNVRFYVKNKNAYAKQIEILPQILELSDYVIAESVKLFQAAYGNSRYAGRLPFIKVLKGKRVNVLPFTGTKLKYDMEWAAQMLLLSLCRPAMRSQNGNIVFTGGDLTLAKKLFDGVAVSAIDRIAEISKDTSAKRQNDFNSLVQGPFIWKEMHTMALKHWEGMPK